MLSLERIGLRDWRNFESADVSLDRRLTVIAGPNAMGKTNTVEAIKNAGIEPVEIAGAIANWDKVQAMNIMNAFIMSIGPENIEAVIANNDEMALGAIEALKANDYNKGDPAMYIPVVGVDANASALEAMTHGEMLGTVLNDADGQGSAAVKLAVMLAKGQDASKEVTDGKYIWVPYQKVTRGDSK